MSFDRILTMYHLNNYEIVKIMKLSCTADIKYYFNHISVMVDDMKILKYFRKIDNLFAVKVIKK